MAQRLSPSKDDVWAIHYEAASRKEAGATGALYATLATICDVGDELVIPEPMYIGYKRVGLKRTKPRVA